MIADDARAGELLLAAALAFVMACIEPEDRPATWDYVHATPMCATSTCHSDLAERAELSLQDPDDAYAVAGDQVAHRERVLHAGRSRATSIPRSGRRPARSGAVRRSTMSGAEAHRRHTERSRSVDQSAVRNPGTMLRPSRHREALTRCHPA